MICFYYNVCDCHAFIKGNLRTYLLTTPNDRPLVVVVHNYSAVTCEVVPPWMPANTQFLELTPLTIPNCSSIGSAVSAWHVIYRYYIALPHFPQKFDAYPEIWTPITRTPTVPWNHLTHNSRKPFFIIHALPVNRLTDGQINKTNMEIDWYRWAAYATQQGQKPTAMFGSP